MFYRFQKPARPVSRVFLHCSASDRPEHDSAAVIDAWHKANGWAGIGYHYFIRKDGTLESGRDLNKVPAAQGGHNTGTIAICLHGLEISKFTPAQFASLRGLCIQINRAYAGNVTFHGHCEVSPKSCPVFTYEDVLGIDAEGKMPLVRDVTVPRFPFRTSILTISRC
ncbi:N-acetylmuramoyl-L-alanine amidase [Paracoccus spongiarum]|uniref:N-acetylmuramoyl-L-alanine amidase n=1 Tax=Paracoccus spongiarum TaxID=3064387 RepID=A0ABT9JDN3_9RHOB|nr:N-acetylmuramoyl-L-alanine amidase [Paracoccus sp. 2205BS29-5]MDP5307912.1 N-acetylmuramoyl-L-alanine amidase [Paracoccus sp. 2205BS29-5]